MPGFWGDVSRNCPSGVLWQQLAGWVSRTLKEKIRQMSGVRVGLPCEYVGVSPPVEVRGSRLLLRNVVLFAFATASIHLCSHRTVIVLALLPASSSLCSPLNASGTFQPQGELKKATSRRPGWVCGSSSASFGS